MSKWDSRFMDLARLVASWSKDPSTQVGAVIVGIVRGNQQRAARRPSFQGHGGFGAARFHQSSGAISHVVSA